MRHALKTYTFIALGLLFAVVTACSQGSSSDSGSSWTRPDSLADDAVSVAGQDVNGVQTASDNNGNVLVVWQQSNGATQQIYLSEYRDGVWTHPTDLAGDAVSVGGQYAFPPRVAMDDNGTALVVWQQYDGAYYRIYTSEYRGGVWTHPADLSDAISPAGSNAYNPSVALDNNGNAVIAWGQYDGGNYRVYKSEYRNGSWSHPSDLTTDAISLAGENAYSPKVALSANGAALIVWEQFDGVNFRIHMSEYRGGVWNHPADFDLDALSLGGQDAAAPQVAVDASGDALIVWQQLDGSNVQIFRSEYRSGGWTHPVNLADFISNVGQNAGAPQVAMAANGDAVIVWSQVDGTYDRIYLREYRNSGWTTSFTLAAPSVSIPGQNAGNPQVAMNGSGATVVTWQQSDGNDLRIYHSAYRNGSWSHPVSRYDGILSPIGSDATAPRVALDDQGDTTIVWQQSDGSHQQVYVAVYR